MSVILKKGKTKNILMPVTPSQAFTADTFVKFSSGKLVPCQSGDAAALVEGVIRKTIASTDADYANDRLVEIEVPVERHCQYEIDVNSGLVATDLGTEFDLADAATVDHAGTTDKVVKLIKYLSATKGIFYVKFSGSGY